MGNAYYGEEDKCLDSLINGKEYSLFIKNISDFNKVQIAEDIVSGIVLWFYGMSEMGPRALGHRSLFADPRSKTAKDKLNRIKKDNGGDQ